MSDELIRRLDLLKNLIALGEEDLLSQQADKLDSISSKIDTSLLVEALRKKSFSEAVQQIDKILKDSASIQVYEDPEIQALRLELRVLEQKFSEKEEKKSEIERILREFEIRYEQALGELISKLMRLKMEKLEEEISNDESKKEEYEEARKTFEEHENTFKDLQKETIRDLNSDELDELKKNYREAAFLCHPDTAAEEFREKSKEAFQKLSEAYQKNDLEGVQEVLHVLKHGGQLLKDSDVVSDKSILESKINSLKKKIDEIDIQLEEYENSEAWSTVNGLDDWDVYFEIAKKSLIKEINSI